MERWYKISTRWGDEPRIRFACFSFFVGGGLIMGINKESDCVSMFPTERKKTDHLALNLDSESPILIEFKPVSLRKQE